MVYTIQDVSELIRLRGFLIDKYETYPYKVKLDRKKVYLKNLEKLHSFTDKDMKSFSSPSNIERFRDNFPDIKYSSSAKHVQTHIDKCKEEINKLEEVVEIYTNKIKKIDEILFNMPIF